MLVHALLTRSPYMHLSRPHAMYSQEWDARDFLKIFFKFFISKPELILSMSSPHLVKNIFFYFILNFFSEKWPSSNFTKSSRYFPSIGKRKILGYLENFVLGRL